MIKLNLARNCLKYIIKAYGIKEIFIPYYSCKTIWKAIREEGCKIHFYKIDKSFLPIYDFALNSYILYINYFGLCKHNCKILAEKYPNLIIDNTQSFYSKPKGLASFNSLRKFFNVQNGAYLYINKKFNYNFTVDDLNTKPVLIHENYDKFVQNELLLNKEIIKYISPQVEKQMKDIDFEKDKHIRVELFKQYSKILNDYNEIKLILNKQIPYCYPFKSSNKEILNKLAQFTLLELWKNDNIISLPLNDKKYAQKIIKKITQ